MKRSFGWVAIVLTPVFRSYEALERSDTDATRVDPSALAVWQTFPQPFFSTVGCLAPGLISMMPTDWGPPASGEP